MFLPMAASEVPALSRTSGLALLCDSPYSRPTLLAFKHASGFPADLVNV